MFEFFNDFMNDKNTFIVTILLTVVSASVLYAAVKISIGVKDLIEKENLEKMIQKEISKAQKNEN